MAVSLVRRKRTSDAATFCARPQGTGGSGRPSAPAGQPPRAVSCVREPPPAQRRRFAHRADAAGPHRYLDHANLHPCGRRTPEKPGARPASAGGEIASCAALLTSAPSPPKEHFAARDLCVPGQKRNAFHIGVRAKHLKICAFFTRIRSRFAPAVSPLY